MTKSRNKLRMLAVIGLLTTGGCAGGSSGDTGSDGRDGTSADAPDSAQTTDASTEDAVPDSVAPIEAPADLGERCSLSCTGATCVDHDSDCEELCLRYTRDERSQAYCSMKCVEDTCPPGWECVASYHDLTGPERVCAALPPDCGNGIVEREEACDDGNREDGDRCTAACDRVSLPSTSGRVSIRLDGTPPDFVFEGAVEGGFARLDASGTLSWNDDDAGTTGFGFEMRDISERDDAEGEQPVRFSFSPFPCSFSGATVAQLTAFDPAAARIAGSFTVALGCQFNCFGCGGDGAQRTATVDFDLVWLAAEDAVE